MKNNELLDKLKKLFKDHLQSEIDLVNLSTFESQEELSLHMGKVQAFNQVVAELELIGRCSNCNKIN